MVDMITYSEHPNISYEQKNTPPKINMEPKYTPGISENHLPDSKPSCSGSILIFGGVWDFQTIYSNWKVDGTVPTYWFTRTLY